MPESVQSAPLNCQCNGDYFSPVFVYDAPPEGEIHFHVSMSEQYHREVLRCNLCGHFVSYHRMDTKALYKSEYVNSTYGDANGLHRTFERIISLDPSKSDNVGRVARILEFATGYLTRSREEDIPTVLDVGSGLCVFLHRMKAAGWDCTALDPDERAVAHARNVVGVKAICADFMIAGDLGRFNLVAFNKVLEHTADPVAMLARTMGYLTDNSFVYIEVPDGEAAIHDGPGREEFFIEHQHVFSTASLAMLAERSGFRALTIERLREPSTKYTLRAFLVRA